MKPEDNHKMTSSTTGTDEEMGERLLRNVKKEVKQIMEESVTRKFVHEESSSITSLCGAVECCLQNGLRKRALGLFKNSTTTALLQKVSKTYQPAGQIVKLLNETEQSSDFRKSLDNNKNQMQRKTGYNPRYLWIRLALFEKQLAKIIDYLVQHSSKYYEKDALIADPVDGPILASLLVGPCALDYTKMKTSDHYWTDPPADELVQRHRIHSSGNHLRQDSPKRPGLQVLLRRHTSSSSEESMRCAPLSAKEYVESLHQNSKSTLLYGKNNVMVQPKEDVEPLAGYLSLHQGPEGLSVKWTPNQLMNGCCEEEQEDSVDRRPIFAKYALRETRTGFRKLSKAVLRGRTVLSQHQFTTLLHTLHIAPFLKKAEPGLEAIWEKLTLYWDYAVTVFMDEIVYLHCHQQPDSGGTIVLVGQDGVQRPPIHFPKGGHLLSFLSCLENGLLPHGQLDPPLWSQRGKGKVFPKMKRKGSRMAQSITQVSEDRSGSPSMSASVASVASVDEPTGGGGGGGGGTTGAAGAAGAPSQGGQGIGEEEEEATDYVFRIIAAFRPESLTADMLDPKARDKGSTGSGSSTSSSLSSSIPWPLRDLVQRPPLAKSTPKPTPSPPSPPSAIQTYARSQQEQNDTCISKSGQSRTAVKQLCDTMTRQILSRAFYGWLSHCRHLKTVRTHLSGLVNTIVVSVEDPSDASSGLTFEKWAELSQGGVVKGASEVHRLVYYGGCTNEVRKEVWPYLLGHYKFESTPAERTEHDDVIKTRYEKTMSEWLAVEAIVRQRDKEIMAANLAKLSQESTDGQIPLVRKDSSLSNDVFESMDSDDFSHPETVPEESSNAASSLTSPTTEYPTSTPICAKEAHQALTAVKSSDSKDTTCSPDEGLGDSIARLGSLSDSKRSDSCDTDKNIETLKSESDESASALPEQKNIIITNPSVDQIDEAIPEANGDVEEEEMENGISADKLLGTQSLEDTEHLSASKESLNCPASPASNASNGGVYSTEMLDSVALNLHRIDKDVQRCDRNFWYFTPANLDKLRNVMCTYVWEHLEVGYVQGMCDLVAPLLVIFDDEAKTYSCFCHLMKRMSSNFPHGGAMDTHFANMRSLIQILDPELFEHMHQNGDYTHFYFCYRWFLLDFKRELIYDDVFAVWETIWAAKHISSPHFVLFIALALVEYYREIIIDNNMDFTDIIKFFNEMAERHNSKQVLRIARDLVYKLQDLIENK